MYPITNPFLRKLGVGCVFNGIDLHTIYSAFPVALFVLSTETYLLELYIPFMVYQSMCPFCPTQALAQPCYSSSVHHDSL